MQARTGGCRLLTCQQLQPSLALLLLVLSLSASLPVLGSSSEVFKYGDEPEHAGNQTGTHWTYGLAGEDWVGTAADGSAWACQSGQQQSPVNLPVSPDAAAPLDALHKASWALGSLTANGSNVRVANDGHGVQVFWQDPSFKPYISLVVQAGRAVESSLNLRPGHKTVTVQAVPRQLHFHTHSEHLLGGRIFPVEAHLVSVVGQSQLPSCPPGGCIVVTAVLFELAEDVTQDSAWLAPVFDAMPYTEGEASHLPAGTQLDLQQLLPANTTYMAYGGSLTTPPCSEGVTWLVLLNSQALSVRQWRNFMKAVGDYNCTLDGSSSSAVALPAAAMGLFPPLLLAWQRFQATQAAAAAAAAAAEAAATAAVEPAARTACCSSRCTTAGPCKHHQQLIAASLPNRMLLSTNSDTQQQQQQQQPACFFDWAGKAAAGGSCQRGALHLQQARGGCNHRLPQPLNGRTLRIWRDVSTARKSYLPEDAASAASAGAVAGIVIGVTLGAGLTAGFGYLGWRLYNKRRLKRFYNMDNDMMMVTQEVEQHWLNTGPGGSSGPVVGGAGAGLARSRHSITNMP
ncbi:alpha carbonic anhydrase [Scenedesmus sp. NREL 46B-D3]|nr:alpha carbonic anhydrase [Scenedesmus sp. NREL 46B-D3]